MRQHRFTLLLRALVVIVALFWPQAQTYAQTPKPVKNLRSVTNAQRKAAAMHAARQRATTLLNRQRAGAVKGASANVPTSGFVPDATVTTAASATTFPVAVSPGDLYFNGYPNYANSPLPIGSVSPTVTVNMGGSGYTAPQVSIVDAYVPATASGATATATVSNGEITGITVTNGGSGYIAPVVVVTDPTGGGAMFTATVVPTTGTGIRKFVDDLPGICDVSGPSKTLGQCLPLAKPDPNLFPGSDYYQIGVREYSQQMHSDLPATRLRGYIDMSAGADGKNHYLGPLILAQRNRPVRVLFKNLLDTSDKPTSNLFIPTDTTYMGAGMGPDGSNYTQNRANLHLHGGNTPWISDGTPHQWITPANDPATLKKGLSFQNVPDMIGATSPIGLTAPADNDGMGTYFWTNQQSGRLMFFHDHSYGITRLNVYAGEAAGYLLYDPAEESALAAASVPGTITNTPDYTHLLPLVIQDKTFVDANTLAVQDPTWQWGTQSGSAVTGDLWFPHVYMPNQWPDNPDLSGTNPMGRWDYGPWFWPPQDPSTFVPAGQPKPCVTSTGVSTTCPGIPNPSGTPEGFMDTPVVNGVAYPVLHVAPEAYRFHILNAANDRYWNLQLYQAYDPNTNTVGSGTEVKMVPAVTGTWPTGWPTPDSRDGGWPDPATVGPSMIQIGTEGGLLPSPAVIPNRPIGYEYGRRSITVLNVLEKALFLGPAERADVVVDFSGYAGKTLIVYNDAPAPVPAFDARIDYYTGDPDQTAMGGAPSTVPGYGPNTRTIMQIVVDQPGTGAPAFNLSTLQAAMPGIFAQTQEPILVPEKAYGASTNTYSTIQATSLTFTDPGATTATTHPMQPKAIQELFTLDYGRMNATLGVELPFTNFNTQTTIPYGYIDPPTETLKDGEAQIWKITHNGVDTHAIHFHLFTVQVLNRVGWDGMIKPPDPNELSWKDTVRMNPLEDVIVALLPVKQSLPWPLPDSVRPLDVTMPLDGPGMGFSNIDPNNNPVTITNQLTNFGQEYVWHCHLLGHEENDMMRPMVFQVPPEAPSSLMADATTQSPSVILTWTDNAATETAFVVQRDTDPLFGTATTLGPVGPSSQLNQIKQGIDYGSTISYVDTTAGSVTCTVTPCTVYYRVQALNEKAYAYPPQGSTVTLQSAWSNIATVGLTPTATVAPAQVTFGNQLVGSVSGAQPVTLTNSGAGPLVIIGVTITGANAGDFSQSNSCGSTLAGGGNASCTINVTFTPSASGARSATLNISTNDPANPTLNVALSGTGIAPAMVLTPNALSFGNQPVNTTSTPALTFTVSNANGTADLVINSIAISGANATDFAQTNTCGVTGVTSGTVTAGTSCMVSVTFTPAAAGARSASLTLNVAAPATAQSVALAGAGTVPANSLSPTALSFGNQLVTAPATAGAAQNVTLTNGGLAPLTISSIAIAGANPGDFAQTNNCPVSPATLAASASCTMSVTFAPTVRGARAATLVVTDNAAGSPGTVTLSGTGIAPVASVSLTPINFGVEVIATSSAPQSVTLLNNGDAPLTIKSITISGTNSADFARVANASNCGTSLAPLANCTISVTFTPTAAGTRSGLLSINTSDPVNPTLGVPLGGTGTAVAVSPTALAFGNQTVGTVSTSRTVTIANAGTTTLTFNSISLTGTNANQFTFANNCGGTLRAGRSCTVTVRFAPTVAAAATASLLINSTDPGMPSASVPLTGTGVPTPPVANLSTNTLGFGTVNVGQTSAVQTVTLRNTGGSALLISSITIGGTNPGDFAQTNNCGSSVAAGGNCTIGVTFNPTARNTRSATLQISDNAAGSPQTVQLSGRGR